MNFLKNLLLSIMGWFRTKANDNVDLRYAGKEHISNINSKITDINNHRNMIVGKGILLENQIKLEKENLQKYIDAIKHHNQNNNEELKNKAYQEYVKCENLLNQLLNDEKDIKEQVNNLDQEIIALTQAKDKAKNTLDKAANKQLIGKAMTKVEDLHSEISNGSLAEVIEQSDLKHATAQAKRNQRVENDTSKVLEYQNQSNVKSLDEILNT